MRNSINVMAAACAVFVAASGWSVRSAAQQTGRTPAPLAIPSMSGSDLFRFYCATCHGREGKGDGPVAFALAQRPANLTTIAARNGGRFPTDRVERFVTGDRDPIPAHGSADMPVWGPIFQALDSRDAMNKVRIANVVAFVESLQAPK